MAVASLAACGRRAAAELCSHAASWLSSCSCSSAIEYDGSYACTLVASSCTCGGRAREGVGHGR
eukprot:7296005-Prymnesium_polylepis.1